jgi:hypothetical protein
LTSFIGFALSGIGISLAIWSPMILATIFIYTSGCLAVVGLGLCLLTPLARTLIVEPLDPYKRLLMAKLTQLTSVEKNNTNQSISSKLPTATLMMCLGQLSLLLVSVLFFSFMESQTRISPRLHELPVGQFFQTLKSQPFVLGLLPWVLYSVMGVGFAYLSLVRQRIPYLPQAILPKIKRHPWLFLHNFLSITVEVNILFPILFVTGLTMVYLCETGNLLLGSISLFHAPFLTMLVLALIIFTFRRISLRSIEWVITQEYSLGNILLLLVLGFAFFMIWLHNIGGNFLTQIQQPIFENVGKSRLVGTLSEAVLQRRLPLFVWGWWMIWIPWMTTFIARWSIGLSVREALIRALILPVALFLWIAQRATLEEWSHLIQWLDIPAVRAVMSIGLLLFIWVLWGRMRNTLDVSLGCMLPLKRWKQRPLKNWMKNFVLWITIYISGWFSMGWIPSQAMSSYGAGFLTILIAFFIVALIVEIQREATMAKLDAQTL